jgi:hypothetical protein
MSKASNDVIAMRRNEEEATFLMSVASNLYPKLDTSQPPPFGEIRLLLESQNKGNA